MPSSSGCCASRAQRADRVGSRPAEAHALVRRQRLRQDEIAVGRIGQTEGGGDPERQARIEAAENAAERRPQHEADAERGADHAEGGGALVGLGHVGNVGVGGGEARRGDAGNNAPDEQPGQARCQRHQDVVEPVPGHGDEQHRAAAEAVGQCAEHRREHELHQCPGGGEEPEDLGRPPGVAAEHALDQLGQHGNDDAERDDIEQHDGEDEGERRPWRRGSSSGRVHRAEVAGNCGGVTGPAWQEYAPQRPRTRTQTASRWRAGDADET